MSTWQGLTRQMRYNYFTVFVEVNLIFLKTFWTWPQSSILQAGDFSQDKNGQSATGVKIWPQFWDCGPVQAQDFSNTVSWLENMAWEFLKPRSCLTRFGRILKTVAIFKATVSCSNLATFLRLWPWKSSRLLQHSLANDHGLKNMAWEIFEATVLLDEIWPHSWDCGNFWSHSVLLKIWPHSQDCGHEKAWDYSNTVLQMTTVSRTWLENFWSHSLTWQDLATFSRLWQFLKPQCLAQDLATFSRLWPWKSSRLLQHSLTNGLRTWLENFQIHSLTQDLATFSRL